MEAIFEFVGKEEINQTLLAMMLIMFRTLPIIFLTPFLGGKLVPPTTKMSLAFLIAMVMFPAATGGMIGPLKANPLVFIVLMLKELFIGYTLGYVASKLFYAMEIGGRILDVMRGSNMAEVQVPELSLRASPLGQFLFQMLLMVFLGLGAHRWFLNAFADSFLVVPIDGWPAMSGGFHHFVVRIIEYSASLFGIAFGLVFPGIFATFMTDVVFGMLNRVAPQLNAYFMAMGVKAMSAIALLFFSLALVYDRLGVLSEYSIMVVKDIVRLFG